MKRIARGCAFLALCLIACRDPLQAPAPGGAVTVSLEIATSRTVVPDFEARTALIEVSLSSDEGHGSISGSDSAAHWAVAFPDVPAGSWDIAVIARDSDGLQVGTGSAGNLILAPGASLSVPIAMSFATAVATGEVSFTVALPAATGIDYLSGAIPETGASSVPAFTDVAGTRRATLSFAGLPSGVYSLVMGFRRGGAAGSIAGIFREKLVVRAGFSSESWVAPDGSLQPERLFAAADFFDTNTSLAALSVSGGILPGAAFSSGTLAYPRGAIASVPAAVSFTATPSIAGQYIEYSWDGGSWAEYVPGAPCADHAPIDNAGENDGADNELQVRVTAPDGETTSIYSVTFSKGYRVGYDGNGNDGGAAPTDSGLYEAGVTVTALGNVGVPPLTLANHVFLGWTVGAGPTTVAAGGTFAMPAADIVLHARWQELGSVTVSLSFDAPSYGSISFTSPGIVERGNALSFVTTQPLATGWKWYVDGLLQAGETGPTFVWDTTGLAIKQYIVSVAATYGGHVCSGSIKIPLVDFGGKHVVRYDANGAASGAAPVDAATYEEGDTFVVAGNTGGLSMPGEIGFSGWSTTADGTGTLYVPGKSYAIGPGSLSLYARWKQIPGATWTQHAVPGSMGGMTWAGVACSTDGMRIVAATNSGSYAKSLIYTSIDGGETWTRKEHTTTNWITGVACSDNGLRMALSTYQGGTIISTDGGQTWASRGPSYNSEDIACSADGMKIICNIRGSTDYLRISSDGGLTWASLTALGSKPWRGAALSADGSTIAACDNSGIYTSSDGGATWTLQAGAGTRNWGCLCVSAGGQRMCAAVIGGYIYVSSDGGATWAERQGGGSRSWYGLDCSPDGAFIAAASYGAIYTSDDYGDSWEEKPSAGARSWTKIACSQDGQRLAAPAGNGYVYTSNDFGATWTAHTDIGSRQYPSIASSWDGSRLVVGVRGGYLYTSSDRGSTWQERTGAGTGEWNYIAASGDGQAVAAAASSGYLYTSIDGGGSWTAHASLGTATWYGVARSSNGARLAAARSTSPYVLISTDGGSSWAERTTPTLFYGLTGSADGSTLVARGSNSYLYRSTDMGASWTQLTAAGSRNFASPACSADGSMIAACVSNGYIYTSFDGGATWAERTLAGSKYWGGIASSADGMILVAKVSSTYKDYFYVSVDQGATWKTRTGAGNRPWTSMSLSPDGTKIAAGALYVTDIFTSP
jgi:hypothetical protein